jgi:hypothetical protein
VTRQKCGQHPENSLHFCSFHNSEDERLRFGWRCSDCNIIYYDYTLGRPQRPVFVPASRPEIECPVCRSFDFDSLPDLNYAKCVCCCSILHLHAKVEPD